MTADAAHQAGGPQAHTTSDDWLTVNVWSPAADPAARRPVMVWIYGGAYKLGSADDPAGGGVAYLYELAWPAPANGGILGACHGLDAPLVFGNLEDGFGARLIGPPPFPA